MYLLLITALFLGTGLVQAQGQLVSQLAINMYTIANCNHIMYVFMYYINVLLGQLLQSVDQAIAASSVLATDAARLGWVMQVAAAIMFKLVIVKLAVDATRTHMLFSMTSNTRLISKLLIDVHTNINTAINGFITSQLLIFVHDK